MIYFKPNKIFLGILLILLGIFLITSPLEFTEIIIITISVITILFSVHNLFMLRNAGNLNNNVLFKYINNIIIAIFVIIYPVFVFRFMALNIIVNMIIFKRINFYKLLLATVLLLRPAFIIDFTLNIIGIFVLILGVTLLNNKEIL